MTTPNTVYLEAIERLDYDPFTGEFIWRRNGRSAGCVNVHGYRVIRLGGPLYYGHRLAYLMTYGDWPAQEIDHADGDRSNNRISNLRAASPTQNRRNGGKRKSATGIRGVRPHRDKYTAFIKINGKQTYLGTFDTPDEAGEAYKIAATENFGDFAYINRSAA